MMIKFKQKSYQRGKNTWILLSISAVEHHRLKEALNKGKVVSRGEFWEKGKSILKRGSRIFILLNTEKHSKKDPFW